MLHVKTHRENQEESLCNGVYTFEYLLQDHLKFLVQAIKQILLAVGKTMSAYAYTKLVIDNCYFIRP